MSVGLMHASIWLSKRLTASLTVGVLTATTSISVPAAVGQSPSPAARSTVAQARTPRVPVSGAPAGVTAFVDVAVIPMDSERVLANQTVLVEGGWITALGPVKQVRVPAGATQIDGQGRYLLPGLADMHAHMEMGLDQARDSLAAARKLLRYLADGVTTIRILDHAFVAAGQQYDTDLHAQASKLLLEARARVAAGELVGPRIYTAGPWAPPQYRHPARNGWPAPRLDSIVTYVAAYKAAGYDFVKPYREPPVLFDSLAAAARRVGIPLMGHIPPGVPVERALAAGMRSVEHLTGYQYREGNAFKIIEASQIPTLVAATKRAGVWNTPTEGLHQQDEFGAVRRQRVKALQDSGAGLLLGSDAPPKGPKGWKGWQSVHKELAALVAAGLTPYQALLTGTRNVAAFFGTLDSTGTIAIGKRADLVLLQGNPLADIENTRQFAGVMTSGRWLPPAELDRLEALLAKEVLQKRQQIEAMREKGRRAPQPTP
jgi:imidazolonepropionase-like amidohydrolase